MAFTKVAREGVSGSEVGVHCQKGSQVAVFLVSVSPASAAAFLTMHGRGRGREM